MLSGVQHDVVGRAIGQLCWFSHTNGRDLDVELEGHTSKRVIGVDPRISIFDLRDPDWKLVTIRLRNVCAQLKVMGGMAIEHRLGTGFLIFIAFSWWNNRLNLVPTFRPAICLSSPGTMFRAPCK